MNDYGKIRWDAYPRGATGKFTYGFSDYRQKIRITDWQTDLLTGERKQVTKVYDKPMYLFEGSRPYATDFMTFEPDSIDFEKRLFKLVGDIPDCTAYVAGDTGVRRFVNETRVTNSIGDKFLTDGSVEEWSQIEHGTITLTPSQSYSGSGITIATQNKAYSVKITVADINGTRSIITDRTEDEFYEFPYNGLKSVKIEFLKLHTGSFLKVIGIGLGRTIYIDDSILLEEPTITTNFDVTGQNLESDTLDLKILNEEGQYNPVLGERLVIERESQSWLGEYKSNSTFYITDVKKNDEAIEISCQDIITLLESERSGIINEYGTEYRIDDLISYCIGENDELSKVDYSYVDETIGNYWFGFLEKAPIKNQLAKIATACGLAISRSKKDGTAMKFFTPELRAKNVNDVPIFNEANVLEGLSTENIDPIARINYSWNNPKTNEKETVEAWHGQVPRGQTYWLNFSEPFSRSGREYFVIKKIDSKNPEKDVIEEVADFELGNNLSQGDYEDRFYNPGSITFNFFNKVTVTHSPIVGLIVKGYPYVDDVRQYSVTLPAPSSYKSNVLDLNDLGIFVQDGTSAFQSNLKYVHSFNMKVKFKSLIDEATGEYVRIETEKAKGYGWLTSKVDSMNGVYEYEAVIKND